MGSAGSRFCPGVARGRPRDHEQKAGAAGSPGSLPKRLYSHAVAPAPATTPLALLATCRALASTHTPCAATCARDTSRKAERVCGRWGS